VHANIEGTKGGGKIGGLIYPRVIRHTQLTGGFAHGCDSS
jgi:hypothetical protein